ncbi:MFS transporter [Lichenicola cladoniae]|uniref:MFS transporter n=1 Tax=Lichenicola cladoniae TaxID=1484109 RepID=A0A6M8HU39_9PROT|nr:MFS transporter [Lichenicola cladoniae]NPD66157.1 MFS transporter [Acetobacteraceae bacterium]QKE92023.1 MFS transporter [Lichenicola cladoniae]
MTEISFVTAVDQSSRDEPQWRRNLYVCVFGAFTTVLAMTLLLPFLPLYVEQLGVHGHAAIVQWSGIAFGATFLAAGLAAPVWGRFADRYGRKLILVRASLGMAVCMSLLGTVQTIWQLVALRLLAGLLGGYASGAVVLVATQTPKARTTWALGLLSSGVMAGSLVGPLVGGALPPLIGVRATFFLAGGLIFIAFLATALMVRETHRPVRTMAGTQGAWSLIENQRSVLVMLLTGALVTLATMSIEPIVTIYVAQLMPSGAAVTMMSGAIMSAGALGSVVAAPRMGRLADRIGQRKVVVGGLIASGLLLLPQAAVGNAWELLGLRFLMGIALAGLIPAITSMIRHAVPARVAGQILALNTSAQYVGFVAGPLLGGFVGAHLGMRPVFLATSAVMLAGAILASRRW